MNPHLGDLVNDQAPLGEQAKKIWDIFRILPRLSSQTCRMAFFFIALDISSKTGIDLCDLLAYRERAKWGDSAEMNVFPGKFIKDKATLQTS